jgi:hypothetical protein
VAVALPALRDAGRAGGLLGVFAVQERDVLHDDLLVRLVGAVVGGPGAGAGVGEQDPADAWPGEPADATTPVASTAARVAELADSAGSLPELIARQSVCRACPRLVEWREEVAVTRRKSFRSERYWGRPVPGWGDEEPSILIVGLAPAAPAAHGGKRTGRVFTGDRSGHDRREMSPRAPM